MQLDEMHLGYKTYMVSKLRNGSKELSKRGNEKEKYQQLHKTTMKGWKGVSSQHRAFQKKNSRDYFGKREAIFAL